MTIDQEIQARAGAKCELCASDNNCQIYDVPPVMDRTADRAILLCATCRDQIDTPDRMDVHHWRCLNDSMWTPVPAVQVMAWRMLDRLRAEGWPQDLLDMLYLEEDILAWAQAGEEHQDDDAPAPHLDCNGATLMAGDTITLIKDLNVKGGGFTAKRGTAVRNISLIHDNPEQIEGRVNGQQIVLLTKFVKKSA